MPHDHAPGHSHDHGHLQGRSHGHSHDHSRTPADFGRAFLIGTLLNTGFVVVEATYGILANSVALLADAGHNLSDVLGLLMAWGAATLSKRGPSERYTYGLRRSSILAALFNAVFLLVAIGAIGLEAARRLAEPAPVESGVVMAVACAGIAVNAITAALFAGGRKGDINVRGAFLHMVGDAMVSAGVVVAAFAVSRTGWLWLDPVTSIAIVAIILVGTWRLLRDALTMALDAVPPGIDAAGVGEALAALPGVERVHDLHIWPMSTTEAALTCHLFMPGSAGGDRFLHAASAMLEQRFGIAHVTIQIETEAEDACKQAPEGAL